MSLGAIGAYRVSPMFPPEDPKMRIKQRTVRLPQWMWDRIDEIEAEINDGRNDKLSSNDMMVYICDWAIREYAKEKKGKK